MKEIEEAEKKEKAKETQPQTESILGLPWAERVLLAQFRNAAPERAARSSEYCPGCFEDMALQEYSDAEAPGGRHQLCRSCRAKEGGATVHDKKP
jgi:hypothetical protein